MGTGYELGIPERTHEVVIIHQRKKRRLTKSFSLHCRFTAEELRDKVKTYIDNNYDNLFASMIEITSFDKKYPTYIKIKDFNTNESKMCTIRAPHYDITEINEVIWDYLCNGGRKFNVNTQTKLN